MAQIAIQLCLYGEMTISFKNWVVRNKIEKDAEKRNNDEYEECWKPVAKWLESGYNERGAGSEGT